MEEEDDVYAEQLKEVFKSCDLQNKGYINRNELIDLSQKLQLGDQVGELLKEILGDEYSDGEVFIYLFVHTHDSLFYSSELLATRLLPPLRNNFKRVYGISSEKQFSPPKASQRDIWIFSSTPYPLSHRSTFYFFNCFGCVLYQL